jgi:hypothetical protein
MLMMQEFRTGRKSVGGDRQENDLANVSVQAKMRYSPTHGKWIRTNKPKLEVNSTKLFNNNARPKINPIDFVDRHKNPFLDINNDNAMPQQPRQAAFVLVPAGDFAQTSKDPLELNPLKIDMELRHDRNRTGQHAGLGLGRPGLTVASSQDEKKDERSQWRLRHDKLETDAWKELRVCLSRLSAGPFC